MIAPSSRSIACGCLALAGLIAAQGGCGGTARIEFVSLHASEIDPPPAKVWRFDAREAWWWIDEAGELNLAFHARQRNPFLGKWGDVDLSISLVPGPPPAGRARNYPIRRRETRTRLDTALGRQRLISYTGIMYVLIEEDGTLRGSFRIWMKAPPQLEMFSILPRRPGPFLGFGTFRAVRDVDGRGRAIRALCESDGWERRPPPKRTTRRPATQPASRPSTP